MKQLVAFLLLIPLMAFGQRELSKEADIHIVTCGPSQYELYSAFGHNAIRVKDSANGIDQIYNYGVFNFNQPNFYLNFAKGYLYYRLAVTDYELFVNKYISEKRYIHEQVLNLTYQQKQRLFDFLQWNAKPENMRYYYDYFYDNCATRIRDAVKKTFGDTVTFDGSYIQKDSTIRELCDLYLEHQPWGDFGIDLALGLPMDKTLTPYQYMFLPEYIESGFAHAYIKRNGQQKPLVEERVVTYKGGEQDFDETFFTPTLTFSLVLLLGLSLTYSGYKTRKSLFWFDTIVFSFIGLLGWHFLGLWFLTDHDAAAKNMHLLWAIPLYLPLAFLLVKKRPPFWLKTFFQVTAVIHFLTLITWPFLPQDLHDSLIPFVVLLLIRTVMIQYSLPNKEKNFVTASRSQ